MGRFLGSHRVGPDHIFAAAAPEERHAPLELVEDQVHLVEGQVEFGSEVAQKMFLNEAQVVGALDHPNILRIYDAGNFKGRPYIAME